jgi:heparin binding hemagglutinin HbhA
MSVIAEITKNVDTTPLYAAVGVTDLAVEKVRDARVRADKVRADVRAEFTPAAFQARATEVQARATDAVGQAKELPAQALNEALVYAGRVAEGYEDLATRGHNLVKRIRNQKATKDLVAQAESTLALGKGAVTTARKAATQVESSAKATLTTGRKEVLRVADVLSESVADEAGVAVAEVKKSAARTRTAAKRTQTTAKNAAKRTTASAKATTTSARKTAAQSTKATKKAAEKVGD